jgi:hypothetical protein
MWLWKQRCALAVSMEDEHLRQLAEAQAAGSSAGEAASMAEAMVAKYKEALARLTADNMVSKSLTHSANHSLTQ